MIAYEPMLGRLKSPRRVDSSHRDHTTSLGASSIAVHGAGPGPKGVVVLDRRELTRQGVDPLPEVLTALEYVRPGGVVVLVAWNHRAGWVSDITHRGHAVRVEPTTATRVEIEIISGGMPLVEDLCDLEPPEPLQRVLEQCEALAAGEVYLARLPHFPHPLLAPLSQRDVQAALFESTNGQTLLHVRKNR